jgi:hypothetical protein
METSPELQWDDFERSISEALAAGSQDIQPPDWVWQRIVHDATNLDRRGGQIKYGGDEVLVSAEFIELVT